MARTARKRRHTAKTGRPTLLTPKVQRELVRYLEEGNHMEPAAIACGVSPATVLSWMGKGRREVARRDVGGVPDPGQDLYVDFLRVVLEAQSRGEVRDLRRIRELGKEDWHAIKFVRQFGNSRLRWGYRPEGAATPEDPIPPPVDAPAGSSASKVAADGRDVARDLLLTDAGRALLDSAAALLESRASDDAAPPPRGVISKAAARAKYLEAHSEGLPDAGFPDADHDPSSSR